jgi:hypothetical protein
VEAGLASIVKGLDYTVAGDLGAAIDAEDPHGVSVMEPGSAAPDHALSISMEMTLAVARAELWFPGLKIETRGTHDL